MPRAFEPITSSAVIDTLIGPHAKAFPTASDFSGYRNHCLRMLNVVLYLSDDEPDRRHKVEIATAFHDLTLFPDGTLHYLPGAVQLAREHLQQIDRLDWLEPIRLMIENHHKVRAYRGPFANLVEPFRRADWIDVSFRAFAFGIDRRWLRRLHQALPLHGFYPRTLVPVIARYVLRHPRDPLPNFRW